MTSHIDPAAVLARVPEGFTEDDSLVEAHASGPAGDALARVEREAEERGRRAGAEEERARALEEAALVAFVEADLLDKYSLPGQAAVRIGDAIRAIGRLK